MFLYTICRWYNRDMTGANNSKGDAMKITHEERFTEMELFRMFNVDIAPKIDPKHGEKCRPSEMSYDFDDVKVRLWKFTKRPLSRGEKQAVQADDHCTISQHSPGSGGRLADLAAFYASQEAGVGPQGEVVYDVEAKSAFSI